MAREKVKITPKKPWEKVTGKPTKIKLSPAGSPKAPWYLTNNPVKKRSV